MYDNRPQRYAFAVGVGGQPVKGLSIGAGIDFETAFLHRIQKSFTDFQASLPQ